MPNPFRYPWNKKKHPPAEAVYAGPDRMAGRPEGRTDKVYVGPADPMAEVYAGPPEPDPAEESAPAPEPMKLVYAGPEQMAAASDPLAPIKRAILDMVRYRNVKLEPENLEGKSLDELQAIHDKIVELPQTVYIDELPLRPAEAPTMLVYAGPQQMNGGMFPFMNPSDPTDQMLDGPGMMKQEPGPEADVESVGRCPACGNPLYARSRFCPECGSLLPWPEEDEG